MARVIPVFIASPSDVQEEREHCRAAVDRLSHRFLRLFGTALSAVDWRDFAPDADAEAGEVFQHRIIHAIEPDSVFVGIVHERIGTPIGRGTHITGTEAEYDYAIRNRGRVRIMTYLKKLSRIDEDQLEVARLRQTIKKADLPRVDYETVEEFADRILLDLLEAVVHGIFSDPGKRRRSLAEFFRFGQGRLEGHISPPLIVYPPIHKHDSSLGGTTKLSNEDWRTRLLPNVVYEDFKTIQKVESALRAVGVQDYRTVTTLYPQASNQEGNRIWLCLPRNRHARAALTRLGTRACFSFHQSATQARVDRLIKWKGRVVRSPLAAYLAEQRPKRRRPWETAFGKIVARDFAVIARFEIPSTTAAAGRPFYHYFIAGVRGLGTWGAGWFLDRYPDALAEHSQRSRSGVVQILLEVTFNDHRIIRVEDVCSKPQSYFDRVNEADSIKRDIAENLAP